MVRLVLRLRGRLAARKRNKLPFSAKQRHASPGGRTAGGYHRIYQTHQYFSRFTDVPATECHVMGKKKRGRGSGGSGKTLCKFPRETVPLILSVRVRLTIQLSISKFDTALGRSLHATPSKKTPTLSTLPCVPLVSASMAPIRKRGRGSSAPSPPSSLSHLAPHPSRGKPSNRQKAPRSNPEFDEAYRNLLERRQGESRSRAFHQAEARRRRARGRGREGLIAPPTFVNARNSSTRTPSALAGTTVESVQDFVESLFQPDEEECEEKEGRGEPRPKRRKLQCQLGRGKEDESTPVITSRNAFAALGEEEEGEGQAPGVVFLPTLLPPPVPSPSLPVADPGGPASPPKEAPSSGAGGAGLARDGEPAADAALSMVSVGSSLSALDRPEAEPSPPLTPPPPADSDVGGERPLESLPVILPATFLPPVPLPGGISKDAAGQGLGKESVDRGTGKLPPGGGGEGGVRGGEGDVRGEGGGVRGEGGGTEAEVQAAGEQGEEEVRDEGGEERGRDEGGEEGDDL